MMNVKPGVVLVAGFVLPQNVKADYYKNAQDYKDRNEAKKGKLTPGNFSPETILKKTYNRSFYEYHEYMSDASKSTGLFDAFDDHLSKAKKGFYQKRFANAYENEGVMWIPIISFDNNWLKEQGIIDVKEGIVDDSMLKEATRKSMTQLLKSENLLGNSYWTASIHYNTDNIHIHVSVVEKTVNRQRGKMLLSNIDAAKTRMVSSISDRTPELTLINDLLRNQILSNARQLNYRDEFDKKIKHVAKIQKSQYGRLSISEKAVVDDLSRFILKKKFPAAYKKLNVQLEKEMNFYRRAYGEGDRHLYQDYRINKEMELLSKMGNSILKQAHLYRQEMFVKDVEIKRYKSERLSQKIQTNKLRSVQKRTLFLMRKIMFTMENEMRKAIAVYEQMIRDQEVEHENQR